MSFKVQTISSFDRQAKRLKKKFPSLKEELLDLAIKLSENPFQGEPLGNDCYKIRIAIASKGRGKSGGGRIVTHVVFRNEVVHLLAIYDKSETASISDGELLELLKQIS